MITRETPRFFGHQKLAARTVWGMDAARLHEHFWASQGIQVVRSGDAAKIDTNASLYLLLDPDLLVLLELDQAFERSTWNKADLMFVRVRDMQERQFRERVVTSDMGEFVRFERYYEGGPFSKLARVLVTRDPKLAAVWQVAPEPLLAAKALQLVVPRNRRVYSSHAGRLYDRDHASEEHFMTDVLRVWTDPHETLDTVEHISSDIWAHPDAEIDPSVRLVGPVWVGAGRRLEPNAIVVGPLVLWDDADQRPTPPPVKLVTRTRPSVAPEPAVHHASRSYRIIKRTFDLAFALFAIALTLPLYPLIILCIWIEDGRPIFFGHRRETVGGRKFLCFKFRSMRKDAEKIKARLAEENGIDGPQFFMKKDPRLTRVGAILRKKQLDELPQFFNVLLGHMSIVGPRPSPYKENQFCPPWREARLSVRPGITGLWQIKRTRRGDTDFQEWINYDLEYVRNMSLGYDLKIMFQTIAMFAGRMAGKAFA
ncbi:MAG: sugar transferase [Phycisphaerae bacterium]|nr:sugar transferase [Phycisphaerae bacterium]